MATIKKDEEYKMEKKDEKTGNTINPGGSANPRAGRRQKRRAEGKGLGKRIGGILKRDKILQKVPQ